MRQYPSLHVCGLDKRPPGATTPSGEVAAYPSYAT